MTPTTLPLDRIFDGVGRIKKASGTTDPKIRRKMDAMLTDLYGDGRLDILRAIKSGQLGPMQVFAAYRAKALDSLPLGMGAQPLHTTYELWRVRATKNTKSLNSRKQSGVYLTTFGQQASRVADLPEILLAARESMERAGHAATFNRLKSAASAFVRDMMGKGSALYREILGVPRIKETTTVVRRPMTPGQLRDICRSLDGLTEDTAWSMATTGMGPGEYWGSWVEAITAPYVHIHGTKRAGRERRVPKLGMLCEPSITRQVFEDRLVKAGAPFKPYDLRRSYANWLEAAGIPRTRRRLYMGHGAGDVTDRYEEHEVLRFLAEDAALLRAYLDRELARPALTLEKAE